MIDLNFLPSFEADAIEIWSHVADEDPSAADRLIERIYLRCLILQEHPGAGQRRPEVADDCRQLVVSPVLVLYRHHGNQVALVRAIYRGRNVTPDMFSGGGRS